MQQKKAIMKSGHMIFKYLLKICWVFFIVYFFGAETSYIVGKSLVSMKQTLPNTIILHTQKLRIQGQPRTQALTDSRLCRRAGERLNMI
jgi:hypothetical protein